MLEIYGSSRIFLAHHFASQSRNEAKDGHRWGEEAGTPGWMLLPQSAQRPTKAIERCLSILAPLSCSVTFQSQEISFDVFKGILQEIQKERIHERDQPKQLERMFPDTQAGAFHRQFA